MPQTTFPQDRTVERLAERHPELNVLAVSNHSMAHLVNEGLKQSSKPYILQMNADVYLEENSLSDMLVALQDKNVAMVGPICYDKNKKLQNQGLLYYRHYAYLALSKQKSTRSTWLSGCCNLLKREALNHIGGLNSSLRFYNEDLEWGWRFNKAGWETRLVNTKVMHLGGSSTPNNPSFLIEGYRGGYKLSQWYKPKIYQALHRFFVKLELGFKLRNSSNPLHEAHVALRVLFVQKSFDQSPFGETLEDGNPDFNKLQNENQRQLNE